MLTRIRRDTHRALALTVAAAALPCAAAQEGQMDGYLGVPNERVEEEFGGGFSLYVAAWPLLEEYPGQRFQTGLFGTWMHAQDEQKDGEERRYSDIEGGLGWWRDTRFATETPKFIMGGVALNFRAWANGPGAGKGRDWSKPQGKYGVAQLSPWVLWPPDGLNLAQGTSGELFGYGYLPLPLTEPKAETAGAAVPTGNQCWTLFLNTAKFKGPVAFFTPYFFSEASVEQPELAGIFLDARPANPNRALQMETQYIPAVVGADESGRTFARVGHTRFPANDGRDSILVHRITSYRRAALWNDVERWFAGGQPAASTVDADESYVHRLTGKGWSTWRIHPDGTPKEERRRVAWDSMVAPFLPDPHTFAYRWNADHVRVADGLVSLPESYVLEGEGEAARWVPAPVADEALWERLAEARLGEGRAEAPEPYVTPNDGCWTTPGPAAGPFEAELGDGSVVTYAWYRFADQPALLNADLSAEERERMQARVELLHRHWTREREYLPPPTRGALASLDPAVNVEPPEGLEIGYVPIVLWQGQR